MRNLVILIFLVSFSNLQSQTRISTVLNDWKFQKGEVSNGYSPTINDGDWETVKVPHDWAIGESFELNGNGDTGKLPWKAEGWYRKHLMLDASYRGKRIFLVFDGVMAFPEVFVNGEFAGKWDYGYNSFYLDITPFIKIGEKNLIAIHADTRKHDSRWYPGGGIYRKVTLLATNPIHTKIWGNQITTPIIKPNYAEIRTISEIEIQKSTNDSLEVKHSILTKDGVSIVSNSAIKKTKKSSSDFETSILLNEPILWDTNNPYLYKMVTDVFEGGTLIDSDTTNFGVRSIKFTADDGFHLNNRRVQLKGVNLHSDLGPLGMAFNKRAMQRQLEIMKDMGANAIRTSHNVAAPELLELCDEMGLLVFNEIFDKYDGKADILDSTDFDSFAHRNIKNFIERDRNHPSVFLWSVGNEIGDVQWNINNGFKRLHTMVNYVNKYDASRDITLVCDNLKSAELRHFDYYDVHAWNYGRRYRLARQLEPNKSVIISESASTVSTRGFYEFPLPEDKTDFTKSLQISSYDLNAPEWAELADDDFMWQQDEPYIAGEFVWTGFDYLGEPTPYNNKYVNEIGYSDKEASRSSYFGIVDLVGLPKDRYYLYKSYWNPSETTIHILPHWNWPNRIGQKTPVFVYTNGDCGELFLNGKSLGKQCKKPNSNNSIERFRLMWKDVVYQPGSLKVNVFKNQNLIGTETLETVSEAESLSVLADKSTIKADGEDLSFLTIEATDSKGAPHPLATHEITIEVNGPIYIVGVGNGNPQSFDPFQSNKVKLFNGKAVVIIGTKGSKGNGQVKISATGLKSTTINLTLN
ncbi:glycoside hydrolase family 2 TIM barrel-domain containing protein [Aegicerativicinus sediminis]|uniref:glycoside hydrolase family 2 TIM barrel-domain containing protein n=1 Tax=Aegicerativicinus sediminis TaxID=2893202 RepID=UPI001E3D470C|nr:glycoside hydrolase family 2 TIM barrel-domain containing protein [Aegicerativicinus sediminis]